MHGNFGAGSGRILKNKIKKKNNKKRTFKLNMRCTKVPSKKTAIGGTKKKKKKCEENKQNEKGAPVLVSGLRTSPSSLHV